MKSTVAGISLLLAAGWGMATVVIVPVQAQVIPAPQDTGTIVTPVENRFDIHGGRRSADGANLFHGLMQFGLSQGQIANFLANPNIQNILVRVTGGTPSRIDGVLQVTGSSANLFLMNPAGIIFGASAGLNVAGSFTATTANGIGFGSNWFSASGANNYEALVGTPGAFAFTMPQPGAIINTGILEVSQGQQLALLGGTVLSTGLLRAPLGTVTVATVPGESVLRLTPTGSLLSLEIRPPGSGNLPSQWSLPIASLPQLLTGGEEHHATDLVINRNGDVILAGSGIQVAPGDVLVQQVTTDTTLIIGYANRVLPPRDHLPPGVLLPGNDGKSPSFPGGSTDLPPVGPPIPGGFDCGLFCPPIKPPAAPFEPPSLTPRPYPRSQQVPEQPTPILLQLEPPSSSLTASPTPSPPAGSGSDNSPPALLPQRIDLQLPASLNANNQSERYLVNSAASLKELARYFQQRWRRSPHPTQPLQYRLVFNAQGSLQEVIPFGQEAVDHMQYVGLPHLDESVGGLLFFKQNLQVLVIFKPDGDVEVIPEVVGLR